MSSSAELRSPVTSVGISAPRPLPNPLRRATAHLLGQLPVRDGAPGGWIEHDDGLPVRRGLREPHRPGNDVPADTITEVLAYFGGDLFGQPGPSVVHGQDDGA